MSRNQTDFIPLLVRRGGGDIKKMGEATFKERTGRSLTTSCSELRLARGLVSDLPACAVKEASLHFLTGAGTPPHEEGIIPDSNSFTSSQPFFIWREK
jgi:hypothetical protein